MRSLMFVLMLAALGCQGEPPPVPADPVSSKLVIGDPAPPVVVTKWLRGDPVTIEPGRVYVVQFWTAWSAPCKQSLFGLDELAREFKEVTFLAVSSLDQGLNTLEKTTAAVGELPKDTPVRFAWCETSEMFDSWMEAAKTDKVPTAFVIDQNHQIVYIEQPMLLGEVLPRVLNKSWNGAEDARKLAVRYQKLSAVFEHVRNTGVTASKKTTPGAGIRAELEAFNKARQVVAPEALKQFDELAKSEPKLRMLSPIRLEEMTLCLLTGDTGRAALIAKEQLAHFRRIKHDTGAKELFVLWIDKNLNPQRQHMDIAPQAAELMHSLRDSNDLESILAVAEASKAIGDKARYDEMVAKARKLVEGDPERSKIVENAIKLFD